MAKLTLSDLASLANQTSAIATINANSALIEAAVENTLSRDGTSPNAMGANLDMNSNRILNLADPVNDQEPVTLGYLSESSLVTDGAIALPPSSTSNAVVRWSGTGANSLLDSDVIITDGQVELTNITGTATTTPFNADPAAADTGYFGNYEGLTANLLKLTQAEVQAEDESGGWRSTLAIHHNDSNTTDYEALGYRTITDGIRIVVTGSGVQYKDLHGITASAIGEVAWDERGVAGVACDAIQYHEGVSIGSETNAYNPAAATAQSKHIAGVLTVVSGKKAASDATHRVNGVEVLNEGKRATAGLEVISAGTDGDNGQFEYALKLEDCTVDTAGILMPASAASNVGSRIIYDTGDYTQYDSAGNAFNWAIGGNTVFALNAGNLFPAADNTIALGTSSLQFADLFLAEGAVINWRNGGVTLTESSDALVFAGAAQGYFWDATMFGTGAIRTHYTLATPAAASAVPGIQMGTALVGLYFGTGAPSAALTAPKGSLYIRTDATTTTTRLYINTDAGTTWATFTTSA